MAIGTTEQLIGFSSYQADICSSFAQAGKQRKLQEEAEARQKKLFKKQKIN